MADSELIGDAFLGYPEQLSIFQQPIQCIGINRRMIHTVYPSNEYSSQGIIQLTYPGTSRNYIDLKNSRLRITCKIVKKDGSDVDAATANSGIVGCVNNFLHSIFSRVEITIQDKVITSSDAAYPYVAYLKNLLYSSPDAKEGTLQMHMYYPDTAGEFDDTVWNISKNEGLKTRSKFFEKSMQVELIGPLMCDVMEISRYIPGGIPLKVTLYPSSSAFCLMSPDEDNDSTGSYKVAVTLALLEVATVNVSQAVEIAHSEVLRESPAVYPYSSYEVKRVTMTKGSLSAEISDPFQGRIPSECILGIVSEEAHHGHYKKNPFKFVHANLNQLIVTVNGYDTYYGKLEPHYEDDDEGGRYLSAYRSLCGIGGFEGVNPIPLKDFPKGYCLYRLLSEDTQTGENNGDVMSPRQTGNMRIMLQFAKALAENMTTVLFAKFPAALKIDKNKAVFLV